jgi:DNA-directed RNA polymerase subunit M/transcription elongation factor TFIIS
MWAKNLLSRIPKPHVDGHQRLACIRDMQKTLQVSFDDAIEYESKAYIYSNGTFTIYLTFVAQALRDRMQLGDFEAFCATGDMSHLKLEGKNTAYDTVIQRLTTTKFECNVVTSTRQCAKPNCRSYDLGIVAKQTRSADEGMTGKYICYTCGHMFSAG